MNDVTVFLQKRWPLEYHFQSGLVCSQEVRIAEFLLYLNEHNGDKRIIHFQIIFMSC